MMDLSKITIKLRPRNGYAAIDLGTRMAQKNWSKMIFSCLFFTLPLYLFLLFLIPQHPLWVAIIIWWLKPLWERPLLLILSQDVFNQRLSFSEVIRHGFKLMFKQLIPALTIRRLSPTRSFDAPVMQLENLSGHSRRERLAALHSRSPTSISGMTFVMHLIEALITFGLVLFILQFMPSENVEWSIFLDDLFNNTGLDLFYLLLSIGWYLAMLLIAPFYVAGGFSSYLNQRSIREAWDLELIFRQLATKHSQRKFNYHNITAAILLCLILLPSLTIPSYSSEIQPVEKSVKADSFSKEKAATKRSIANIKDSPDYKRVNKTTRFRLINPPQEKEKKEKKEIKSSDSFMSGALAKFLSWLFIALIIIFILFKIPAIIEYFSGNTGSKNQQRSKHKPEKLFGLDLNQETLPEDVVTEALKLWDANKSREALGLLYRASLSHLIHDYACEFEDGFTELECEQIVTTSNLPLASYFSQLTQSWRSLAYGHKIPSHNEFNQLADQWGIHFVIPQERSAEDVKPSPNDE